MLRATQAAASHPVDCSQLVAPVDRSPQRSPQAVHSVLASRFHGLDLVEIGTHGGDGMNCFAQVARSAVAIEVDPRPCELLRKRAKALVTRGRGKYSVVCDTYQNSAIDADVYTWWREHPLTNEGILRDLQRLQQRGQLRTGARAYPLFDHKWPSDMASWASLQPSATWHANVSFNECMGSSWAAVRSSVSGSLWPSTKRRPWERCTGWFTVAEIPIAQWNGAAARARHAVEAERNDSWVSSGSRVEGKKPRTLAARAGPASQLSDGRPAALKRATQQHDSAPSSACTVHRGAVLHAGKLWNVTGSPLHAQHRQQRDRAANVSQLRLRLTTPFFGDASGIPATAAPPPLGMPRCERVKRGVLTAAAGGYGCAQLAHYLFNFLLPQWDAMQQIGWLPPASGGTSGEVPPGAQGTAARLFLDCGGHYRTGMTVSSAPAFVRETLPLLAPMASVRSLATHGQATRGSVNVCFDELLVGCDPCAQLDEYNGNLHLPALATRVATWRRQLMAIVLQQPESALAWLASSRRTDGRLDGAAVVLTDRRSASRQWLNVEQSRLRVVSLATVRSATVVRWEGMSLREQMRVSMAVDVMIGIEGTNLANAMWMRSGSVVVSLIPFGARTYAPHLSDNFRRLWDVAGVRVLWSHSSRHETRVRDVRCAEELRRNATLDQKLYVRCGLLDAPAWIFPDRVRALVASAVEKSARFAPAFAAQGARSGDF